MPTVYLPLNSAEAHGKFGETIVFQGTTVRKLTVSKDPRTVAQVTTRNLFHDCTKMIKSADMWPKAAWRTILGSRWYSLLYKKVKSAITIPWEPQSVNSDDVWSTFDEARKDRWREAAPFQATYNDPGLIYWYVYFGSFQTLFDKFLHPYWSAGFEEPPSEWWTLGLGTVGVDAVYDETSNIINYTGTWNQVSDVNAHGGGYKKQMNVMAGGLDFYFYGRRAKIIHMKGPGQGNFSVTVDYENQFIYSLYDAETTWQEVFDTGELEKGLHYVSMFTAPMTTVNFDGMEITNKKIKATIPKITGARFEIGFVEMPEQINAPATPAQGKQVLYFKDDGKLYKKNSAGVEAALE